LFSSSLFHLSASSGRNIAMLFASVWIYTSLALISIPSAIGLNTTDPAPLSSCVQTCQDDTLQNYSCQVNFTASTLAADCFCAGSSPVYHALTSCMQQTCTLEEILHWQQLRAQKCQIQPRDASHAILIICCVMWAFTSIFCIGRLLSRSKHFGGPGFWWDDWVVFFLYIVSIEMVVDVTTQHGYRAGVDVIAPEITTTDIHGVLLWCYVSIPFYFLGTGGSKLVFSLLYVRMWKTPGLIRQLCWALVWISLFGVTVLIISSTASRWPWKYYYGDSARVRNWILGIYLPAGTYGFSAINIFADFVVLLVPIPMLMQLRGLSRQRKIGIATVFLAGFIATAASLVRLAYIPPLTNSLNVTWDFGLFMLLCQIELHLAMICINVPTWTGLSRRFWTYCRTTRLATTFGSSYATTDLSGATATVERSGGTRRFGSRILQTRKAHSPQGREFELTPGTRKGYSPPRREFEIIQETREGRSPPHDRELEFAKRPNKRPRKGSSPPQIQESEYEDRPRESRSSPQSREFELREVEEGASLDGSERILKARRRGLI